MLVWRACANPKLLCCRRYWSMSSLCGRMGVFQVNTTARMFLDDKKWSRASLTMAAEHCSGVCSGNQSKPLKLQHIHFFFLLKNSFWGGCLRWKRYGTFRVPFTVFQKGTPCPDYLWGSKLIVKDGMIEMSTAIENPALLADIDICLVPWLPSSVSEEQKRSWKS